MENVFDSFDNWQSSPYCQTIGLTISLFVRESLASCFHSNKCVNMHLCYKYLTLNFWHSNREIGYGSSPGLCCRNGIKHYHLQYSIYASFCFAFKELSLHRNIFFENSFGGGGRKNELLRKHCHHYGNSEHFNKDQRTCFLTSWSTCKRNVSKTGKTHALPKCFN